MHSGVYAALLVCHGFIASMATRVLARMPVVFIALNLWSVPSPSVNGLCR